MERYHAGALPPDVRKGSAFPLRVPISFEATPRIWGEAFPHIRRQSRILSPPIRAAHLFGQCSAFL